MGECPRGDFCWLHPPCTEMLKQMGGFGNCFCKESWEHEPTQSGRCWWLKAAELGVSQSPVFGFVCLNANEGEIHLQ